MLQLIKDWLNGSREYYTGVSLYAQNNPQVDLLEILRAGPNDFRKRRLLEEILAIYKEINVEQNDSVKVAAKPNLDKAAPAKLPETILNPDLYAACKSKADEEYKKVMNARAVLFKMANRFETWEDPNLEHCINERAKLAIEVVQGFQRISDLYDTADFVKANGRLPLQQQEDTDQDYEHLPDALVKQRLDNARKAYNKMKKKETTPARVALLQQHEINIKKLTAQWHSLQPTK